MDEAVWRLTRTEPQEVRRAAAGRIAEALLEDLLEAEQLAVRLPSGWLVRAGGYLAYLREESGRWVLYWAKA